jgi:type IV pilus assembly protein PilA
MNPLLPAKSDRGFTTIELLVVILILGIMTAAALPSFLSQGVKAKESEAKQNLGLFSKHQMTRRTKEGNYASNFDLLAMGSLTGSSEIHTTANYTYTIALINTQDAVTLEAKAIDSAARSFMGGTIVHRNSANISTGTNKYCIGAVSSTVPVPMLFDNTQTDSDLVIKCGASMVVPD